MGGKNNLERSRKRQHLNLAVFAPGVLDGGFDPRGGFFVNPVRAALAAHGRWDLPDHNHPKPQLGGEGGCSRLLAPTTQGTEIRLKMVHGCFFLLQKPARRISENGPGCDVFSGELRTPETLRLGTEALCPRW